MKERKSERNKQTKKKKKKERKTERKKDGYKAKNVFRIKETKLKKKTKK